MGNMDRWRTVMNWKIGQNKQQNNVHIHGPVLFFFFYLFFNTATCGEGVYMLAKCSGYRSQCNFLQHQDKLPNQRLSQPFISNKL